MLNVLATAWDVLVIVFAIVTGDEQTAKWLERDQTVTAPCSTVAECQELSKAHRPDVPATTNSEEDE